MVTLGDPDHGTCLLIGIGGQLVSADDFQLHGLSAFRFLGFTTRARQANTQMAIIDASARTAKTSAQPMSAGDGGTSSHLPYQLVPLHTNRRQRQFASRFTITVLQCCCREIAMQRRSRPQPASQGSHMRIEPPATDMQSTDGDSEHDSGRHCTFAQRTSAALHPPQCWATMCGRPQGYSARLTRFAPAHNRTQGV